MLGVIPLNDVKIVSLSSTEISISYVNLIANTHYLKFSSPEETLLWIRSFELATQEDVRKVVKNGAFQQLANSVKDLKSMLSSIPSTEPAKHRVTDVNKRSYLPVYWEKESLEKESFECFSSNLQLDEYYGNASDDTVQQGWRVLGGTLEDLVLWCIITSDQPGMGMNIIIFLLIYKKKFINF